jgi:hypothetical protein
MRAQSVENETRVDRHDLTGRGVRATEGDHLLGYVAG